MISKVMLDYLDSENVPIEKKREYIKNCNLNLSDMFSLMDRYKYENDLMHRMINSLIIFEDDKLKNKIKKQNKDNSKAIIYRRMKKVRREKSYD